MSGEISLYQKEVYATPSEAPQSKRELIVFALDQEWYGADVQHVTEIIPVPSYTPLPNVPRHIMGIVNLRGLILSLIHLKTCLGLSDDEIPEKSQVVVVKSKGMSAGFLVDGSTEILSIPASKLEAPISTLSSREGHFLEGQVEWQGKLIALLDVPKVLEKTSLGTSSEEA